MQGALQAMDELLFDDDFGARRVGHKLNGLLERQVLCSRRERWSSVAGRRPCGVSGAGAAGTGSACALVGSSGWGAFGLVESRRRVRFRIGWMAVSGIAWIRDGSLRLAAGLGLDAVVMSGG